MRLLFSVAILTLGFMGTLSAQTTRDPKLPEGPMPLEAQLKAVPIEYLAKQARLRGDARRGALVFYKSPAGCVNCHVSGTGASPLGPKLDELGKQVTDAHLVESLLHPSRKIDAQYRTKRILTADGDVLVGLVVAQNKDSLTLRLSSELSRDKVVDRKDIDQILEGDKSLMPEGLVSSLSDQREFLDLACYLMEVAAGGTRRAKQLKPAAEQLAVIDDSTNLDHAGIIRKLRTRDFQAGERIYHGYCFNCHGKDGNTPSLPTARAFGTQKLKFGADPYQMFMTLTKGKGLMAAMSHLTPKERYQAVHYIREQFMRESNPDYQEVDKEYLAGLPKGTEDGTKIDVTPRERGPALASQLERKVSSALTIDLGALTVSYNLHTLDQAGIWRGGFLDLSETQHYRPRGEGTANPDGTSIAAFQGWAWGHDGGLDYPRENLPPRGPLPSQWMDYRGHFLYGRKVVLSYAIDGREILHLPLADNANTVRHRLQIGPGQDLLLSVARAGDKSPPKIDRFVVSASDHPSDQPSDQPGVSTGVAGERQGMTWLVDSRNRIVLTIPSDSKTREIEIHCTTVRDKSEAAAFARQINQSQQSLPHDFDALTSGGPQQWPEVLETTGYLGLQQGAYAMDTLTIPDVNPFNSWIRTSCLDFFEDGRMVVGTYGGDIWIVSGVDEQLRKLKWKRFAAGLYEPMGVKVAGNQIYVTCKDRLTRLHDLNDDGEADYYESFSADDDVSVNFHAFNFDLQTDNEGNFYYAKSGHGGDSELPGQVAKISADGKHRSIYCTGFRTPNGMGALPDGRVTASDNQGQWMPASKINLLKPGGFYGWVQTYSIPGMWSPGGGKIDISKVKAPETFDQPLIWMPQDFDNSSGGQLFVRDPRFGPLAGRLFHTSFGKGWMYYLMLQDFGDVAQAAVIKLPFDFRTGVMRARVNPADGQVYATGLQGWNGGARVGLKENGIQRIRYTGKPFRMVADCQVEADGLRIDFNFPLDRSLAVDADSFVAHHWNYHWRRDYGSDMYSPTTDKPGKEPMNVSAIELSEDAQSVTLKIDDLKPVNQVHVVINVKDQQGEPFSEEIYWTINKVPSS